MPRIDVPTPDDVVHTMSQALADRFTTMLTRYATGMKAPPDAVQYVAFHVLATVSAETLATMTKDVGEANREYVCNRFADEVRRTVASILHTHITRT